MGRARPVLENTALYQPQLLHPNRGRPRVPVGRHPGPGGVRKRPGKLSGGLGDYLEDCAASRQSLRSSSYVKTICSPRSPCSKCPRPDIREKRRISVVGRPSSTAARCSPTSSWIFTFNVTLNLRWLVMHVAIQFQLRLSALLSMTKHWVILAVCTVAHFLTQIVHEFGRRQRTQPIYSPSLQ